MRALVLCGLAAIAAGMPSYPDLLPSGRTVACPAGDTSCTGGYCAAIGHATCLGGTMPNNAFGLAFKANGYAWTQALCAADSDGDGLTNGEELGDPCCAWTAGAQGLPSMSASTYAFSHPGVATERTTRYVARSSCVESSPPVIGACTFLCALPRVNCVVNGTCTCCDAPMPPPVSSPPPLSPMTPPPPPMPPMPPVGVLRVGAAAFGGYLTDLPGALRHIRPSDLPAPNLATTPEQVAFPNIAPRPYGATLRAPPGFLVEEVRVPASSALQNPRRARTAPNGVDVFVAEQRSGWGYPADGGPGRGRIRVLQFDATNAFVRASVFAANLTEPFGMVFWPPAPAPATALYVGCNGAILKFPYADGDAVARGPPERVADLPTCVYHSTRDLALSKDGSTIYVGVGSFTNVGDDGAAAEVSRAAVLAFDVATRTLSEYATGIRNPAGVEVHPVTGDVWAAVNERDMLGPDLPPDYVTTVPRNAFFGWPYHYIGRNKDPRFNFTNQFSASAATRSWWPPRAQTTVRVPDVLIQAHSAPLSIAFYSGAGFPADYCGHAFVSLRGSWNRAQRTGYKVVRVFVENGRATGVYQDFLVGFVQNVSTVWGRPVGLAFLKGGALVVTDDSGNSVWKVTAPGSAAVVCGSSSVSSRESFPVLAVSLSVALSALAIGAGVAWYWTRRTRAQAPRVGIRLSYEHLAL